MSNIIHPNTNVAYQFCRTYKCGRLILAALTFAFVVSSGTYGQSPVRISQSADNGNYKIGVGDVLKIVVLKQDLLSQDNVRVSNEGTIRMPMLS